MKIALSEAVMFLLNYGLQASYVPEEESLA
jgi:hypothetical protein